MPSQRVIRYVTGLGRAEPAEGRVRPRQVVDAPGVYRVLVAAISLVGPAGYLHAIRVAWCCRRVACRGL